MLAGGWNREKKGVKRLGQYRGSNHGGGGSAKRTPEEGLLVPSDVPDGLTNINGPEIAAQFENSDDYRHL
jgi:hypothetical protein